MAGWLTLPPDLHLRDLWQQTGGGVRMLSLRRCGGTLLRLSNAVKLGATSTGTDLGNPGTDLEVGVMGLQ